MYLVQQVLVCLTRGFIIAHGFQPGGYLWVGRVGHGHLKVVNGLAIGICLHGNLLFLFIGLNCWLIARVCHILAEDYQLNCHDLLLFADNLQLNCHVLLLLADDFHLNYRDLLLFADGFQLNCHVCRIFADVYQFNCLVFRLLADEGRARRPAPTSHIQARNTNHESRTR